MQAGLKPLIFILTLIISTIYLLGCRHTDSPARSKKSVAKIWVAPDTASIPAGTIGDKIRYGKELLTHTAKYFGPNGSIAHISNGMNCQNCHLDGGTKSFANNYAMVSATYPKMTFRSGKVSPASQRIVECFERSLNGCAPDTTVREVHAMLAYLKWVGRGVKRGEKLFGTSTQKLPFMNVAADPVKGKFVYLIKCKSCHGIDGQGNLAADKKNYAYPPLWGIHSFNDGAGMYRLSNMAAFVKNNMPYGVSYKDPQLTDAQAWDVAAYINSQPRPHMDQHHDWPDISKKPFDFPYAPYADTFSQKQHKLGPFKPIVANLNKNIKTIKS